MIQYYFHEKKYIEVSKCYKALFDFVKKINEKLGELEKNNKEIKPEIIENYLTVKRKMIFKNYLKIMLCSYQYALLN